LAKVAARELASAPSYEKFLAQIGNSYGWSHPDWKPGVITDEKLRVPIITRSNEDTVTWLYKQVAPALRRLLREDAINIVEFLQYVMENPEAEQENTN
jgi:hypothetical protein